MRGLPAEQATRADTTDSMLKEKFRMQRTRSSPATARLLELKALEITQKGKTKEIHMTWTGKCFIDR